MSHAPADQSPHAHEAPTKRRGGPLRIILFVVLVVMLALLGYDQYARRASAAAMKKVKDYVEQSKLATPEEVHALLGRKPDNGTVEKDHYYEEIYSWRRGILVESYTLKVFYRKKDDKVVLDEFVFNEEPDENTIPKPPPRKASPEETVTSGPEGEDPDEGEAPNGSAGHDGDEAANGDEPEESPGRDDDEPADEGPPGDQADGEEPGDDEGPQAEESDE